jgi:hemoglobin
VTAVRAEAPLDVDGLRLEGDPKLTDRSCRDSLPLFLIRTIQARRNERRPPASSLYARIQYAGGLRRLVDKLYPRVLADPSLTRYFKHLDDERLKGLRWHMLTLLAVVTGGPSKYQGRDLHQAHADLQITGEAFDRVAWHLQRTLQELEVRDEDQQAILAAVQARRQEVVTFEES